MAEAAADVGDEASFTEFAPGGVAFAGGGGAELFPEAEGVAGLELKAMEALAGDAEVLDLAGGEGELGGGLVVPELGGGLGKEGGGTESLSRGLPGDGMAKVEEGAVGLEEGGLAAEEEGGPPGGELAIGGRGGGHQEERAGAIRGAARRGRFVSSWDRKHMGGFP